SAREFIADASRGRIDYEPLLDQLPGRLKRTLLEEEVREIKGGMKELQGELKRMAETEQPPELLKKLLLKTNDVIVPALFRGDGLNFDYRTHATFWTLGQEFKVWCATSSHPQYDGRLIFRTANFRTDDERPRVEVLYDYALSQVEKGFL